MHSGPAQPDCSLFTKDDAPARRGGGGDRHHRHILPASSRRQRALQGVINGVGQICAQAGVSAAVGRLDARGQKLRRPDKADVRAQLAKRKAREVEALTVLLMSA